MTDASEEEVNMTDTLSLVLSRFCGSLSCTSSAIIIYIIFKSNSHLSIIYHRIMFGMSVTDIISSLSVALTTLPMPRIDEDGEEYLPGVTKLGNTATCSAQGYLIYFGSISMFLYNSSLWIYYCCSIAIKMNTRDMKRYVEPFLHLIPIISASVAATSVLFQGDGYGVEIERPYCTQLISSTPFIPIFGSFIFASALISLIMILNRIWRIERNSILSPAPSPPPAPIHGTTSPGGGRIDHYDEEQYEEEGLTRSPRPHEQQQDGTEQKEDTTSSSPAGTAGATLPVHLTTATTELRRNVKIILIQASAYLLSYFVSSSVIIIATALTRSSKPSRGILLAHLALFPLQGVFNCMIFIFHKAYSFGRLNIGYNSCELIGLVFAGANEPMILTRISLLQEDRDAQELEQEMMMIRNSPPNSQDKQNNDENDNDDGEEDDSKHSSLEADTRSGLKIYLGSAGDKDGRSNNSGRDDLSGFDIPSLHSSEHDKEEDNSVNANKRSGRRSWFHYPQHGLDTINEATGSTSLVLEKEDDDGEEGVKKKKDEK